MSITEIHPKLPRYTFGGYCVVAIVCNDGCTLSVQASRMHYCEPRVNEGPHTKFEVLIVEPGPDGYYEPLLQDYSGDCSPGGDRIFMYVPANVIDAVIEGHGGINKEKTYGNNS